MGLTKRTYTLPSETILTFEAEVGRGRRSGVIGATLWNAQDETLPARHGRLAALELIQQAAAPCPPLADPDPTGPPRR